ncbi:MAG: TrkH family potassium uptake protein [Bacteroidales bacterium]|nr:TrkH family potassium uptake protein [Bacteroidales bacterium]
MNPRGYRTINMFFVINLLGRIVVIESLFMLFPLITSIYYDEAIKFKILASVLITFFSGLLIFFSTKNLIRKDFSKRESFLLVTLSWLVISLFGLIPFVITGELNFTDAFFETVSGFTTTGASNLFDIEAMPKSLLFWRSETHWIGRMDLFESLTHTFGTVATGGFSTRSASVGAFSPYIQYVIVVFMILAGINFSLYLYLIKRNFSKFFKNEELKFYILIIIISTAFVFMFLLIGKGFGSIEETFRHSIFQTVSILTTTGYGTIDYLYWPHAALAVILLLMFVGASAGSTTGNMKVIRHVIFVKNLKIILNR